MLYASSLEMGLFINFRSSDITLSAPKTSWSGYFELTLIDLSSAKFFEIISGSAPFSNKDSFT